MKSRIETFLQDHLPSDLFVVAVTVSKSNNHINVYLDGDAGVTVDACGMVSRQLEGWLDEEAEVPQQYTLNVNSAGVDQPLVRWRQFRKNVNRHVSAKTLSGTYGGKLVLVDEHTLILKTDKNKTVPLTFDNLQEAKVEI